MTPVTLALEKVQLRTDRRPGGHNHQGQLQPLFSVLQDQGS